MEAIRVKRVGGPEVLEWVEVPVPAPKGYEATVKIAASGVNDTDVYYREGRYETVLPFVVGQEAAGEVVAIGSHVKSIRVGDRVGYTMLLGSYAEYAPVPADRLVKIPAGVNDRQAAAAMFAGNDRALPVA